MTRGTRIVSARTMQLSLASAEAGPPYRRRNSRPSVGSALSVGNPHFNPPTPALNAFIAAACMTALTSTCLAKPAGTAK